MKKPGFQFFDQKKWVFQKEDILDGLLTFRPGKSPEKNFEKKHVSNEGIMGSLSSG